MENVSNAILCISAKVSLNLPMDDHKSTRMEADPPPGLSLCSEDMLLLRAVVESILDSIGNASLYGNDCEP